MKRIKNLTAILTFFLLTVLIVGLTFFFLEQSIISKVTPGYYFDPISLSTQIIFTVVILMLISIFGIHFVKRIRLSVNGVFIISLLVAILVMTIVNVLSIPESRTLSVKFLDGTFHDVILTLSPAKRVTSILTLIINIAFIYFIILVLPNHPHFLTIIKFFVATIAIVSLAAIIYSLVTEKEVILNILKHGYSRNGEVPSSFFNNRNPYASFLLSSQVMMIFLYFLTIHKRRRHLYFLLQIPLMFGIFLTFSKTNIILSFALFFFVFYRHLWHLYKRGHYRRLTFETIVSSTLIIIVFLFRVMPPLETTLFGKFLRQMVPEEIFGVGASTFGTRITLWRYAITLIVASPTTLLIGDGTHLARYFYQMRIDQELGHPLTHGFGDYHNGTLEVLHTFGLVGVVLYALTFILIIVFLIRRRKVDRPLAFFVFISMVIFIARSQTESLTMLLFKSEGIMASFTFILPFLYLNKRAHNEGFGKAIKKR